MSVYPGAVPVSGYFSPTDTTDTYAVTDSQFNRGGHKEASDLTDRNNISVDRRREGMTCYTVSDKKMWQLQNGITNSDWVDITSGTSAGGDATYVHNQITATNTWTINHSLSKYPSVMVVDSNNYVIVGDVSYTSNSQVIITFTSIFFMSSYCLVVIYLQIL